MKSPCEIQDPVALVRKFIGRGITPAPPTILHYSDVRRESVKLAMRRMRARRRAELSAVKMTLGKAT